MIRFALFGARGRMGRMILEDFTGSTHESAPIDEVILVAGVEHPEHPDIGHVFEGIKIFGSDETIPKADVWVDFSLAEPAVEHTRTAAEKGIPIVVAATGFGQTQLDQIRLSAENTPVMLASNLSLGMGAMNQLTSVAARLLGDRYDPSLVELHHSTKRDAPSGTAKSLIELIKAEGYSEVPVSAFRVGGIIGEHQVRFTGQYDELIITHRAWSRRAFSQGISRAVKFLRKRSPGLYSVSEMFVTA